MSSWCINNRLILITVHVYTIIIKKKFTIFVFLIFILFLEVETLFFEKPLTLKSSGFYLPVFSWLVNLLVDWSFWPPMQLRTHKLTRRGFYSFLTHSMKGFLKIWRRGWKDEFKLEGGGTRSVKKGDVGRVVGIQGAVRVREENNLLCCVIAIYRFGDISNFISCLAFGWVNTEKIQLVEIIKPAKIFCSLLQVWR